MGTKYASKQIENEIVELSRTKSEKEISKIYGRTQSGIHLILKRNGVQKLKKSRLNMGHLALDIDYFRKIDSSDKAYWLGFICADGNVKKTNNKVSLISKDLNAIEGFKEAVKSEHKISTRITFDKRTNKTYTGYTIQIGNELFTKNLINLGVTSNKTNILEFPNIDEIYYSYFIAGLFDGDGSIGYTNNDKLRISLISTKEVLTFIGIILNNKGIKELSKTKVSKNKDNVWKMYLYKDSKKFLEYIYGDTQFKYYLTRKYNKYKNDTRT